MKSIKSFVALLAVAAILFMLPGSTLTASAEEGTTYCVKYSDEDKEWRYQPGSIFDDSLSSGPFHLLTSLMKDGDLLVVFNDSTNAEELDLGELRLNNLTVVNTNSFTIIKAKSIENCYVLANTSTSINAEVTNAIVYDSVLCNFGGNVKELTLHANDEVLSTIGCSGKVGHFYAPSITLPRTFYNCYSFTENTFYLENGNLLTAYADYTWDAPAATPQPSASTGNTSTGSTSSGDYDHVPKTGENNPALWFLGAAALCGAASFYLRKKAN